MAMETERQADTEDGMVTVGETPTLAGTYVLAGVVEGTAAAPTWTRYRILDTEPQERQMARQLCMGIVGMGPAERAGGTQVR